MYIVNKLHGVELSSLGAIDLLIYLTIIVLPILSIWLIFAHINSYLTNRNGSKKMNCLFDQMKRNQDYSDLIARILIECEQNLRSGFILNRFDIFISEVNELISEILSRSKLISEQKLHDAWETAKNGEKWGLSKLIIDLNNKSITFNSDIITAAREDNVMSGTLLEFCARYQKLLTILEKHDKEKVFLDIVETGVLGKVFSIFAPIAETIKKEKRAIEGIDIDSDELYEEEITLEEPKKKGFFSRMFGHKNKDAETAIKEEPTIEKDSFSKMLDETNFEPIEDKARDFNIELKEDKTVAEQTLAEEKSPFIEQKSVEETKVSEYGEYRRFSMPTPTFEPENKPLESFRPFSKTEQAMANLRQDKEEIRKYETAASPSLRKEPRISSVPSFEELEDSDKEDKID